MRTAARTLGPRAETKAGGRRVPPVALRGVVAARDRAAARLAADLRRFFRAQAKRVTARWLACRAVRQARQAPPTEHKGLVDDLVATIFPEDEVRLLARVVLQAVRALYADVSALLSDLLGLGAYDPTRDPAVQAALARAGRRIVRIDEETRQAVRAVLAEGLARGYSDYQIAHGVPKDGYRGIHDTVEETYRNRCENIARTEMGTVQQEAAVDRYQDAGVQEVEVLDGPGCGWRGHTDPRAANGLRVSLAEAAAQPLSHPRCRRVFVPVLPSGAGSPIDAGVPFAPIPAGGRRAR
jgi:hypothetical protein